MLRIVKYYGLIKYLNLSVETSTGLESVSTRHVFDSMSGCSTEQKVKRTYRFWLVLEPSLKVNLSDCEILTPVQ